MLLYHYCILTVMRDGSCLYRSGSTQAKQKITNTEEYGIFVEELRVELEIATPLTVVSLSVLNEPSTVSA